MDQNTDLLETEANPCAFWTRQTDPATGREVPGYGANTIFRFHRPVFLKRVEIDAFRHGGEVLKPKSVAIEVFEGQDLAGKTVFEGAPAWRGEKGVIEFAEEICAFAVSVRCDRKEAAREHCITMWDPAEWNVWFGSLLHTRFHGRMADMPELEIPVKPALRKGTIAPQSSGAVKAREDGMFVHFESRFLKVSFSLLRPFMSHLSWDALGERPLKTNFLADYLPCHSSGPWTLDLADSTPPFHWGGSVEVEGNRVIYRDLECRDGLKVDARFEIGEKEIIARFTQRCGREMTLWEAAAWRLVWDVHPSGSVSTFALPVRGLHRNGYTRPEGGWHAANEGCLAFEVTSSSSPVLLHTEQSGFNGKNPTWNYGGFGRRYIFSQIQLGTRPLPHGPVTLQPGEYHAEMRLSVVNPEAAATGEGARNAGLRRAWGSGFFFRPEQSGLANNSCSVLAANVLYGSADMAVYAATARPLPAAVELVRYTLDTVLKKSGPHYGSQYEFHHDAAPSLLIAAGRVHQAAPDAAWLGEAWPDVRRLVLHVLGNLDDSGMYACQHHSGNSGSEQGGGSNAWDDVGFGHHDGYSAALAYRALHCAAALASAAGEPALTPRCLQAAAALKSAYVKSLLNPATGWLAGWRSRDGQLHDYGFLFVNGMAIAFGILEGAQAGEALARLEAKRVEVGHTDFRYGLMTQLLPVPSGDLTSSAQNSLFYRGWRNGLRPDGWDTFGVFCNGCLTSCFAGFYLSALSKHGFTETADRICDQLLASFEAGVFDGDRNGAEFYTHEGIPCGYEGSLIHNYYVLAEIAKHKGWVEPVNPEWWPAVPSARPE